MNDEHSLIPEEHTHPEPISTGSGSKVTSWLLAASLSLISALSASGISSSEALQDSPAVAPIDTKGVWSHDSAVPLSEQEQAWIREHPRIRLGVDPEFAPYEFIAEDGSHRGIAADYVHLLNKRLGLNMEIVPALTWGDVMGQARRKEIDVLPALGMTEERKQYLIYTSPYLSYYRIVITRTDAPFIGELGDIQTWRVAVQADTSHEGYLKDHTDITPIPYDTLQDVLTAVADGEVDAMIGNVGASTYWIRELSLTGLKAALPVSEEQQYLHFAVRDDWSILAGILEKGLASLGDEEKSRIRQGWMSIDYEVGIPRRQVFIYIAQVTGGALLLLLVIMIWNYRLKTEITRRTQLELDLKASKEVAETANRAKSQFLANMSHELRTPLNAVIGYSEMIQDDAKEQGVGVIASDAEKIRHAGQHLLSLVNDILDLSKVEVGKMDVYRENFSINEMIQEVLLATQTILEKNGNRLQAKIPENLGRMDSDQIKVRQIILNLLSNANKFTSEGIITMAVGVEDDDRNDKPVLELTVSDTGIGMSEEHLAKLYNAFTQADSSTKRMYGGTGLGMAITKNFVDLLQGEIEVESKLGHGTTFTIRLPIVHE